LEDKIHNSWVDPRSFKNDEEYAYANKTAWAFASCAQQIIDYVNTNIEQAEMLSKKEKGQMIDKLREGVS
jgi:hypothetical protein